MTRMSNRFASCIQAQIQEKVFANVALKNELRKLKGNSVDTKFAKASILGKPPLQPSRNHLVVRQPNAFTSERPRISRPRLNYQLNEVKKKLLQSKFMLLMQEIVYGSRTPVPCKKNRRDSNSGKLQCLCWTNPEPHGGLDFLATA
ncbi:hypothetical protein Tco_1176954 [Tanacetum coccineum]